jgi:hypothetical protein
MKHAPQLQYSKEWDRWVLWATKESLDELDRSASYCMVIDHSWDGECWDRYRFVTWIDGDWYEVVTNAEYRQYLRDVEENEGTECRELFDRYQERYQVVFDDHPVFNLKKHWEAMMQLQLFTVTVTMQDWKPKPLSEEAVKLLDAARDRYMKEQMDDMDEQCPRIPSAGGDPN